MSISRQNFFSSVCKTKISRCKNQIIVSNTAYETKNKEYINADLIYIFLKNTTEGKKFDFELKKMTNVPSNDVGFVFSINRNIDAAIELIKKSFPDNFIEEIEQRADNRERVMLESFKKK